MHFNKGDLDCRQGITNRHTGVGVGTRVDHNKVGSVSACGLNAIHQFTFVIALIGREGHTQTARHCLEVRLNLCQGRVPIEMRFA
jgi:hypothetical protein